MEPPTSEKPQGKQPPPKPPRAGWGWLLVYVAVGLALLWVWQGFFEGMAYRTIDYSQFKQYLAAGEVVAAKVGKDEIKGKIVLKGKAGAKSAAEAGKGKASPKEVAKSKPAPSSGIAKSTPSERGPSASKPGAPAHANEFLFRTVRVTDPGLVAELEAHHVRYTGVEQSMLPEILLAWVIPIGLIALLWWFLFRRAGGAGGMGQAVMSFGKSRARLVAEKGIPVNFDDVAGCEEAKAELREIVQFLRDPTRFTSLGATIPKGVLLVGPPGTGKTLLARAVAGEAKVPFFSLSGSDFVEMFVGVGAARVRDLFVQAKTHAPCIVFIDELDAIGRARGVHLSNINDEREHTLNQLLVEMDGFEANVGVILLAATNRPDVLDPALLRPGRFDRQVVLDAPDVRGREQILRVHARGKRLAPKVDLRRIAQATPGFSGADLANAINEAALLAARRGAMEIAQTDLEEAVEKVVAGPERRSRRLGDSEKRRVAYHESGHAVVASYSEHADPVRKISIVPRGRAALGYTIQLPTGDQLLMSRSALLDRITGLLGGRAAEEIVLGEVSTGAENDLEQATSLARRVVSQFGMGRSVGLMHCARNAGPAYLGPESVLQRDCSDQTAHEIDEEVKELLEQAYKEAKSILTEHRDGLERVAETLLVRETLDEVAFRSLLGLAPLPASSRAEAAPVEAGGKPPLVGDGSE